MRGKSLIQYLDPPVEMAGQDRWQPEMGLPGRAARVVISLAHRASQKCRLSARQFLEILADEKKTDQDVG